jgi:hypothetical protein
MALPIRLIRAFIRHSPVMAEAGCLIVRAILYRFLGKAAKAMRDEEMLARTSSKVSISRWHADQWGPGGDLVKPARLERRQQTRG